MLEASEEAKQQEREVSPHMSFASIVNRPHCPSAVGEAGVTENMNSLNWVPGGRQGSSAGGEQEWYCCYTVWVCQQQATSSLGISGREVAGRGCSPL